MCTVIRIIIFVSTPLADSQTNTLLKRVKKGTGTGLHGVAKESAILFQGLIAAMTPFFLVEFVGSQFSAQTLFWYSGLLVSAFSNKILYQRMMIIA